MKKPIDITLTTIHVGSRREVATLAIDGKDPAAKFLTELKKKDANAYDSIQTRIRTIAEYEHYQDKQTFRPVGGGIYEFKRNNPKLIRLYAFYDEIEGEGQWVICTNGGDKTHQKQDIAKAKAIRKFYLEAKKQDDTTFIFEHLKS